MVHAKRNAEVTITSFLRVDLKTVAADVRRRDLIMNRAEAVRLLTSAATGKWIFK